ncbi:EamA family transporter [Methylotenera sp.]|uniref:EamA family transporter n=1 Tax=Methylotenera sp. TaxID=2051956 RepID=UPI0025EE80C2|nr:EamA family transporter [Methylotenera sp.]
MLFAGFTAVIAKQGLVGISAELGLTLRTLFVCVFIIVFGLMNIAPTEVKPLQQANYLWLSLSATTTAGSWIFYYKALKMGDVARSQFLGNLKVVSKVNRNKNFFNFFAT